MRCLMVIVACALELLGTIHGFDIHSPCTGLVFNPYGPSGVYCVMVKLENTSVVVALRKRVVLGALLVANPRRHYVV